MKQRRGWLWLTSGVLLALLAGLMTFQIVNELATSASVAEQKETITVSVIVSAVDIAPYVAINAGMVKFLQVPAAMAPREYVTNIEDVIGKMSLVPITLGEILVTPRLVDPADPDAPVLYTMNRDEVLVTVPTFALAGQLGLLAVGQHIDIAYTGEFTRKDDKGDPASDATPTTFLSLQNLEIKSLLSRAITKEGISPVPDAILLAVTPQEALILKFLIDAGAPMDFLLRAPGNNSLLAVSPVDEQFLTDYFQLDLSTPLNFANRNPRTSDGGSLPVSDGATQIQSLIQDQTNPPQTTGGN